MIILDNDRGTREIRTDSDSWMMSVDVTNPLKLPSTKKSLL